MSLKRVLDILKEFGFKRSDAKVYVYLVKKGPHKARDICVEMKLTKQQLYPCLENLQNKGVVYSTIEHPAVFYAINFEKVLDMFVILRIEEAETAQKHKAKLLSIWRSLTEKGVSKN